MPPDVCRPAGDPLSYAGAAVHCAPACGIRPVEPLVKPLVKPLVNLGARGQRDRQVGFVIAVALGLGFAMVAIAGGLARPWRALAFAPFFVAALCLTQARAKT